MPKGGYFISLDVLDGCAKEVVRLAKEAGVALTPRARPIRSAATRAIATSASRRPFQTWPLSRTASEGVALSVLLASSGALLKTQLASHKS